VRTWDIHEFEELACGYGVTPRKLKRWADEKILPRTRVSLGRGRGTTSFYPEDSERRLKAVLRLMALRRSFDEIRVRFCFLGFDVDAGALRTSLLALLPKPLLRFNAKPTFESAQETIASSARSLNRSRLGRSLKERVPNEEARLDSLAALLAAASGANVTFGSYHVEPGDIDRGVAVERLTGVDAARVVNPPDYRWLEGFPGAALDGQLNTLDLRRNRRALESKTIRDLEAASRVLKKRSGRGVGRW